MLSDIKGKQPFLKEVEKQYGELKASYQQLTFNVKKNKSDKNFDTKMEISERALNMLSWKIDYFKNSQLDLDRTINNSFAEVINVIKWRNKEIELELKGRKM